MEKRIKYVCAKCGLDNIHFDATAQWSSIDQQHELISIQDQAYCCDCDFECDIKEVVIEESPAKNPMNQEEWKEVAMIAVILSDNYMKELYEIQDIGYIACIDILSEWAKECFKQVENIDWEDFQEDATKYGFSGDCACWDDAIIEWGAKRIKEYKLNY